MSAIDSALAFQLVEEVASQLVHCRLIKALIPIVYLHCKVDFLAFDLMQIVPHLL